ncbi:MAG: hypothetical protein ACXWUP_01550, partial [Allosphingosinicella sp.]
HIDRFVQIMFGTPIDRLDTQVVINDDALFERLCRVISLTEQRGYRVCSIGRWSDCGPLAQACERVGGAG